MSTRDFERPVLRPGMVPGLIDPDQVFLLTETRQYVLIGREYRVLVPLLDGERSTGEAVEAAAEEIGFPKAVFALQQLIRKGYVVEGAAPGTPPGRAAWWDALGAAPREAQQRLGEAAVVVEAVGAADGDAVVALLREAGLGTGDSGSVRIVVTDDYLRPELAEIDARRRADGAPWLLAKPTGTVTWLGPLFVPGATACWHCLAQRIRGNRQVERYVESAAGEDPLVTTRASAPAPTAAALRAIVAAAEQWAVTGTPPAPLAGRLRTHDLAAWETTEHAVVRRPQCPACGDPELRDPDRVPAGLEIQSRPKRFTADGGHRTVPPEVTWRRLEPHVSPVTGIVSSLIRKEPPENTQTFSYASGHDFVQQGRDLGALRGNLRFRSGGKGMTDRQARVSAVCEAIERWSGIWRGDEARVHAPIAEVADRAVPVEDLLLFSDGQYEGREEWNRSCSPTHYHVVPRRFDREMAIDWVHAHSLSDGSRRLVPAAYAYYGHPESAAFFCATDANGTSAGNTIEEAIVQGFLELVERDAVAVWWYNRLRYPALDLDSFGEPYLDRMREHYRTLDRDLHVLDLTHDLGIPVFAGVSRRLNGPSEDILVSFGAHFDPRIAVNRAVTEVNQFLPAVAPRNPDGTTRYAYDDPDAINWWSAATLAGEPYLLPDPDRPATRRADFDDLPRNEDLRDDVEFCVETARRAGLDLLVVDQSRPDVELNVARVIVPGLRHFWRRLGPGRLYDVPVAMSMADEPRAEAELNPVSMFF